MCLPPVSVRPLDIMTFNCRVQRQNFITTTTVEQFGFDLSDQNKEY